MSTRALHSENGKKGRRRRVKKADAKEGWARAHNHVSLTGLKHDPSHDVRNRFE